MVAAGEAPASTRERLLEAAGEVFGERGFRAATVREICSRAGANVGAVNYHFGDKRRLYLEVLRYAFERGRRRHPLPEASTAPVAERLRGFVRVFLARLFEVGQSWHGRLVARELADPSEALEEVAHTFMRPTLEVLEEIVAAARPDLDPEARRLHALGLIGQCVFFRHARPVLDALFGAEAYAEEQIPALTEHIVEVFLRGLGLTPPEELA